MPHFELTLRTTAVARIFSNPVWISMRNDSRRPNGGVEAAEVSVDIVVDPHPAAAPGRLDKRAA